MGAKKIDWFSMTARQIAKVERLRKQASDLATRIAAEEKVLLDMHTAAGEAYEALRKGGL